MPTSIDKPRETNHGIYRNWSIGIYALPALFVLALFGMVINHLDASKWVSEAAEAEFAGTNLVTDGTPAQLAQPANPVRTVKAY